MIELKLLTAFSIKENLLSYSSQINPKTLSVESITILKDYEVYFNEYPEQKKVDFGMFSTFFFNTRHPFLDEKSILMYKEIIKQISVDVLNTTDVIKLIQGFEKQEFYNDLRNSLEKNIDIENLLEKIASFKERITHIKDKELSVDMDLEEALENVDRTNGLLWRNESLRKHFNGGLIKGDFGIVAGYTDSGKTSFLSSELSYMAQQLKNDQYILWLNNEGDWRRILPRIYSATLNCTEQDLVTNKEKAIEKYKQAMHGDRNRIIITDIQGKHIKDIERLVKERPPALIVFDMLDHLRGFEKYVSTEGSHERFGQLYQWARELSSKYCPIIATSQLNREGSNCMYPDITNMKGSGVDKQAAAVYLLMIGALQGDDNTRFLSTPKFKLGAGKGWRTQVTFDSARSRFI